jgi:HK97 family phage prohead protease
MTVHSFTGKAQNRLDVATEFKFANEAKGEFGGYASVFGGVDSYGDQIAPGAFARSLAERKAAGRSISMYMQHGAINGADPRPVGIWDAIEEDSRGLKVSGHLVGLDTETGRYNLALMREGAMRGLSIGYNTVKASRPLNGPKRILQDVDLVEISIVDRPADANAGIMSLRGEIAATDIVHPRDFEKFLRESGFSKNFARTVTSSGFKAAMNLSGRACGGSGGDYAGLIRGAAAAIKQLSEDKAK